LNFTVLGRAVMLLYPSPTRMNVHCGCRQRYSSKRL